MFPTLFALSIPPVGVALIVACCVAGVALGILFFKKDTEIENRRRAAAKVATILTGKGLLIIPSILSDYAVGDYSGMVAKMKNAADMLLNPAAAGAEFDGVFARMLEEKLKDPEQRAALVEKVNKLSAAYGPPAAAASPAPTVAAA